jgi:hypothetical protein
MAAVIPAAAWTLSPTRSRWMIMPRESVKSTMSSSLYGLFAPPCQ